MLVLSRKLGEKVMIGGGKSGIPPTVVTVVQIDYGKIRLGFEAAPNVPINRTEILDSFPKPASTDAAHVAG
jgi:carbon storage regulator